MGARQSRRSIAHGLQIARGGDTRRDFGGTFRWRRKNEIRCGDGRHFDAQIDAVHQGAGDARLIIGGAAIDAAALAGEAWLERVTAAARIHRSNQHETRRISNAVIGARHRDLAILQRRAQRIEHARIELRQFIEKQNALMRQRNLTRSRAQAAACERRHAGGVMRRAERPACGERSVLDFAGHRSDHRDFEEFRR